MGIGSITIEIDLVSESQDIGLDVWVTITTIRPRDDERFRYLTVPCTIRIRKRVMRT